MPQCVCPVRKPVNITASHLVSEKETKVYIKTLQYQWEIYKYPKVHQSFLWYKPFNVACAHKLLIMSFFSMYLRPSWNLEPLKVYNGMFYNHHNIMATFSSNLQHLERNDSNGWNISNI